jgi:hypothetical protein
MRYHATEEKKSQYCRYQKQYINIPTASEPRGYSLTGGWHLLSPQRPLPKKNDSFKSSMETPWMRCDFPVEVKYAHPFGHLFTVRFCSSEYVKLCTAKLYLENKAKPIAIKATERLSNKRESNFHLSFLTIQPRFRVKELRQISWNRNFTSLLELMSA